MSDVGYLLISNEPAAERDLRNLGHVFFPGRELTIHTGPAPYPELSGPHWRIEMQVFAIAPVGELLPAGLQMEVSVTAPDGRQKQGRERVTCQAGDSPRVVSHRWRVAARGLLVDMLTEFTGWQPGWGFLTGVRPTKVVHAFLDEGLSMDQIRQRLMAEYRFTPEKADLVCEVAAFQRPFLQQDPRAISIYIGIPYCPTICSFCSFSIYPVNEHRGEVPTFLDSLHRELETIGGAIERLGLRVETIYLGGGTPTSPSDEQFAAMLDKIGSTVLKNQKPVEYTVEAGRPETFNNRKLDAMAAAGVGRLSVNPQTTVQATLMHLGRIHTVEKFYRAFELVRSHAHPFVINSDIIVGLPGEGVDEVRHTLADMQRLAPDNFTVHTLAIKRGSRLFHEGKAEETLTRLSAEEAEQMLHEAAATARAMGQHPYYLYRQKHMVGSMENVGYALPGMESLYNIQMMEERQTIVGLGGGATSKYFHSSGFLMQAPDNPKEPAAYILKSAELAEQRAADLQLLYGEMAPVAAQ